MAPKSKTGPPLCDVCSIVPSKYRCPTCPTRYCSVVCFKGHKVGCSALKAARQGAPDAQAVPELALDVLLPDEGKVDVVESEEKVAEEPPQQPLKSLSSLKWPPEPDPSIFTDPLLKDDPKPLRHEELLRIAQSKSLRALLADPTLIAILQLLDTLPLSARHATLSRLVGLDTQSLSSSLKTLVSGRDSPPPLDELLEAFSGTKKDTSIDERDGWWLHGPDGRIWITEKERNLMRLFAGGVCLSIDGKEENGEIAWGQGDLAWDA
ncbi:hypothetical protein L202_02128 [Cryptococcus amylolentus CBS 6039]|uniref:HIT-type domain-containing protein n=1 Tax=Cryptococcus amylolentus CBS 6039 TaxID=1295533 RepID=A0A1E3HZM9_9TREE|nr:hypothetical protein L202_02128 [Cryptococcus amylolentus CBS 6039]ODN81737.1 hypothetical protein L202_02128 [Cryptococcus amylolentus CBS 6039]